MDKMTAEQQQMVLDNYNLVHYVMHKKFPTYFPGGYDYEDLSQEGYLGLCLAAIRYNDELSSFSTYAFNYIWGKIMQYINKKSGWAFHIRPNGKDWKHISYSSLNEITCEGNSNDHFRELHEIVPDRKCMYDEYETYIDILPAFKKAHKLYGEKIFKLLLEGYTQCQISEILGITRTTISRIITKAKDIYWAYTQYDPKYPEPVMAEMKIKGYSNRTIAQIFNITTPEVRRILNKQSIK